MKKSVHHRKYELSVFFQFNIAFSILFISFNRIKSNSCCLELKLKCVCVWSTGRNYLRLNLLHLLYIIMPIYCTTTKGNMFGRAVHSSGKVSLCSSIISNVNCTFLHFISSYSCFSSNGDVSGGSVCGGLLFPNCGWQLALCDEKSDSIGGKERQQQLLQGCCCRLCLDSSQFRLTKINSTLIKISSVLVAHTKTTDGLAVHSLSVWLLNVPQLVQWCALFWLQHQCHHERNYTSLLRWLHMSGCIRRFWLFFTIFFFSANRVELLLLLLTHNKHRSVLLYAGHSADQCSYF